jgi:hypothetical protein
MGNHLIEQASEKVPACAKMQGLLRFARNDGQKGYAKVSHK